VCGLTLGPQSGSASRVVQAQQPPVIATSPAAATPTPATEPTDAQKRLEAFNIVWNTIQQFFFDPAFGGLDWNAVRAHYEPLVTKANTDAEVHDLLQLMLNELHQSHFLIIPPDAIPQALPDEEGELPDEGDAGGPEKKDAAKLLLKGNLDLTKKLVNGIGIDVRIINGMVVVSRVVPGSTAARAGLRPGFVIKKANGNSLETIIAETLQSPIYHAIIRPELPLVVVAGYINGPPGTAVRLSYLDGRNRARTMTVTRERLKGEMSPPVGSLPAMYGEIDSRRLASGIGYVRFNAFVPPLMEKLCHAVRLLREAPGIVLDLRGNSGGLLGMVSGLFGILNRNPQALGFLETRGGRTPLFGFPQKLPYQGSLVILIDGSTQSAAEMFAASMQESGRAYVIGETSAGNTLPSTIRELPTGALFQYAFANYHTSGGTLLEGHGVVPDLQVKLSRAALLTGHDPQLDAAVRKLQGYWRTPLPGKTFLVTSAPEISLPKAAAPPKTSVVISAEPPPPAPQPTPRNNPSPPVAPADMPTAVQIIEKYIAAIGGRTALGKLHSRVSVGRAETSLGVNGALELYQKAPNKFARIITVPGLGVMMRGNNDQAAWWQDELQGYIEISGAGWFEAIREGYFNKASELQHLYPEWALKGKEKVGEREAYVLQGNASERSKYYFDVENGLLLREGNTFYEDYREVDGVKLPFTVRENSLPGFAFVYKITEIKHNVVIDDSKFAPYPSCFTDPGK
jgi:carboxyl-terminal processing protease